MCDPARVLSLSSKPRSPGPALLVLERDLRARDNWALIHAAEQANAAQAALAVCVCLPGPAWQPRQAGFLLRGLRLLAKDLAPLPLFVVRGDPAAAVPKLARDINAGVVVCDFSPLREARKWRDDIARSLAVPVHVVDSHNVVPCWVASPKLEVGARTLRPKLHALMGEYLAQLFPSDLPVVKAWDLAPPPEVDWDALVREFAESEGVPEVDWAAPGYAAGMEHMRRFLGRIRTYEHRNDPTAREAQSDLSPWLHFGHISPQRVAHEARKLPSSTARDGFIEELVVRRELADNFCWYQPNYDSLKGAWAWAQETLRVHAKDPREYVYTAEQLERGKTHDALWNAAQTQLVRRGKLQGFMRMYWAKKILEWTATPETALAEAIRLNDKYSLDGTDPNGYVGCMWSIAGVHDMGWAERSVFGKIRFMNLAGCKRKFDVDKYIASQRAEESPILKKLKRTAA